MKRETLEIEIQQNGEVKVLVKGKKGARCLDVRDLFREILGPVTRTDHTDEFYENEAVINLHQTAKARSR
jgi:hypothetical protein